MKTGHALKASALSLVIAMGLAGCGGKSANDSLESAKKHLAKRDTSAAMIELKSALQQSPNLGEARYLLGVTLLEQGNPAAALLELRKAEDGGYDEQELAPKVARALVETGKAAEVISRFGNRTLTKPEAHAELRTAVAESYGRLNKAAEAEAAVDDALKVAPTFGWAMLTKARLLAVKGEIDKALALADKAIETSTAPNGAAWQLKGDILSRTQKDADIAIKAYEQAAADPRLALAARMALVRIYFIKQDMPSVKAQLNLLKKSHPRAPLTLLVEAQVAFLDKNFLRARELTQELLRAAPNNPQFLLLAGAVEHERGDLVAAETHLGRAAQTSESGVGTLARKLLAKTYLRQGQGDKALTTLRPLLEGGKAAADTLSLAGEAQLQLGDVRAAEAAFTEAVKRKPNDANARTALALTDLLKGNAESAFGTLQAIAAKDPGITADMAMISARIQRREFDAALQAIAGLEKKDPGKAMAPLLRGQVQRDKGDVQAARASFEDLLKREPSHGVALVELAALDVLAGNYDAARKRLADKLAAEPKLSVVRLALVKIMEKQAAKPADIRTLLTEGVRLDARDAGLQTALIDHLINANESRSALEAAQAAQTALPDNVAVLDGLGRAYSLQGDDNQAVTTFNRIATLAPKSPGPHLRLSEIYSRKGNVPAWTAAVNKAFEIAPDSPAVLQALVKRSTRAGDAKPGLDAAQKLQRTRPNDAIGFTLQGDIEAGRKNWPGALAAYRQALDKNVRPDTAAVSVYLAHAGMGRAAEADKFASEWLAKNPKDVAFMTHLGSVAMARKNLPLAERRYAEVLALQPNNVLALNNVAWLMVERGSKDGLKLAEKAAKLAPGSPLVLDTLAHALAADGQTERAIATQKTVVALAAKQYQYRLNLAKLYLKAGQRDPAKAELDLLVGQRDMPGVAAQASALLKTLAS